MSVDYINLTISLSDKFWFNKTYYPAPVKSKNLTPALGPFFIQNSDTGSCSGKNCRLRPESTRALRLRDWCRPGPTFRGGRSHFFRLRLRSCSKIFWSGSESGSCTFSNVRIRLLFRLRLPSPIQPNLSMFLLKKWLHRRSYCWNWKVTPGPFFHKFLTPAPGPKEKRRILPESTPALRIHAHLCRPDKCRLFHPSNLLTTI